MAGILVFFFLKSAFFTSHCDRLIFAALIHSSIPEQESSVTAFKHLILEKLYEISCHCCFTPPVISTFDFQHLNEGSSDKHRQQDDTWKILQIK